MIRWFGAWLVAVTLATGVTGQTPTQPKGQTPAAPTTSERGPPVPEYAVAMLCTLVILTVVCMPSRKR